MDFATARQRIGGIVRRVVWGVVGVIIGLFLLVFLLVPHALADVVVSWPMLLRVLIVIAIELLLSWFLYLRLRREPLDSTVFSSQSAGSINEIGVESVGERLKTVVEKLADIVVANTTISNEGGRADVEMDVTLVNRDINLPEKEKELNRTIQQVIQKQLGLQLAGTPRIYLRFEGRTTKSTDEVDTVLMERAATYPPIDSSQPRTVKSDKPTQLDDKPTDVLDTPPKAADLLPDEDERSTVVDPVPSVNADPIDSSQSRTARPDTPELPDDHSTALLEKPPKIADLMPDEDERTTLVEPVEAVQADDTSDDFDTSDDSNGGEASSDD